MRRILTGRSVAVLLALTCCLAVAPAARGASPDEQLARAQELLNAGDAQGAVEILDRIIEKKRPDAEALLVRSTAFFVLGEVEAGRADLQRALETDPGLRQAWLNRAALDISERDYDSALEALQQARELDPSAIDNDLNLGAVLLLKGELAPATEHFKAYLEANPSSAEAYYLVASNYAMAGYAGPATEDLRRAISLDEKIRLRARTDPNFQDLESNPRFQQLLNTDTYAPSPGGYARELNVAVPYTEEESTLLRAVLDALQFSGAPFDSRVEVTPAWALIWGEMRIKLEDNETGGGRIELTAPADHFSPMQWQAKTDNLLREITVRLTTRSHR